MNLPATGWEVFYNNGKTYSSKQRAWEDIPMDGVVVVLMWHDYHVPLCRQKTILTGSDYYYYVTPELWGCTNDYGIVKGKDYKRGVWIENERMEEIYRTAFEKLDF